MNFNLKKIEKIDLFDPYIIVVMVILFVIIAMPMWYYYCKLPAPELNLFIYIGLGLIIFILGIYFSKRYVPNISADDSQSGDLNKLALFDKYSKDELILTAIVSVGILLQIINILNLGGIPLFSASLKARAASKIWLLSYIIFLPSINILLAKYNRNSHYILLVLGLLLFALTGYRTTPIAILLSSFITLYYTREIKLEYQILFFILVIIVLLTIGFIAVQAISWQHWTLKPMELISYRAAFTLNILSKAIANQFATMGNLFYSTLTGFFTHTDPRVLVGQATLGQVHSITSTIFGPALLDFGLLGMMVQMFLLGLILKTLHVIQKNMKSIYTAFYGIILAQTIIWIETGPTDLVVWIFYLISIFLIIYFIRFFKRESKS